MTGTVCMAQLSATDTIKVIKNPEQVTITRYGNEVQLNVEGYGLGKRYEYQYNIKPDDRGSLATSHREGRKWEFNHPFKAEDTISTKSHFQFFLSDFYFGWGGCKVANSDVQKTSMSEIGILNLIGAGYMFNANRTRLSLGVGFAWSRYGLKPPYFYSRSDAGVVGHIEMAEPHNRHKAMMQLWSMQVPLMLNQKLGKKWNFSIAAIMNWNYFAEVKNRYRLDKTFNHRGSLPAQNHIRRHGNDFLSEPWCLLPLRPAVDFQDRVRPLLQEPLDSGHHLAALTNQSCVTLCGDGSYV